MLQKIKYVMIIMYATALRQSVVDWFGSTYVIYGNVVKKIRG